LSKLGTPNCFRARNATLKQAVAPQNVAKQPFLDDTPRAYMRRELSRGVTSPITYSLLMQIAYCASNAKHQLFVINAEMQ
jgi:hypothetical protein